MFWYIQKSHIVKLSKHNDMKLETSHTAVKQTLEVSEHTKKKCKIYITSPSDSFNSRVQNEKKNEKYLIPPIFWVYL